jgi:quinoprotein glucose dehydrogenase
MRIITLICLVAISATLSAAELPKPQTVRIQPASDEGERAMKGFKLADGLSVDIVASEPLLANPVAFDIDEKGNFYVVESFRLHKGVTDIRQHMNWLDEELASQSVEDMRKMYHRHKVKGLTDYSDRVRLLVDTDDDGLLDKATVFADGFNDEVDGLAAGVLPRYGKVWFTNIPHLWLLEDADGDGVAEKRRQIASGFGVRVGFLGHDLHGLRLGPDGRVYFSIGDRAASVTTAEGRKLHTPESGTIYRCELDGSDLEVYHTGLRNPQELAFDQFGNLFTGDNNSDGGDPARWVNAVESGDSGWRIGWQFLNSAPWTTRRGPWLDEKMCFPDGRAAHRIPPIANIGNGPSGLTYYPGTGFGDRFENMFLMCDFKGTPSRSGIHAIRNKPLGAHFLVDKVDEVIWNVLLTDVEFGFDGNIYVSDWVNGWGMTGKGRLYRLSGNEKDRAADQVKKLFAGGIETLRNRRLAKLLGHVDMRVRMAAQFELVKRDNVRALARAATQTDNQLTRLHGIWGLGQISRRTESVNEKLLPLLKDADAEVRTQTAKVLGDAKYNAAHPSLVALLADKSSRARAQAAIALSKLNKSVGEPLIRMIAENNGNDPVLQHAGILALASNSSAADLVKLNLRKPASIRTAAVVALRRKNSRNVAAFLNDGNALVQLEAARAIADAHIDSAMPQLADLAKRTDLAKPVMRRALNANFRLAEAEALASVASNNEQAELARGEALNLLAAWENPSGRDRVTGLWRPIAKRDASAAATALGPKINSILRNSSGLIRNEAIAAAAKLKLKTAGPALLAILKDEKVGSARAAALRALGQIEAAELEDAVAYGGEAKDTAIRSAATRLAAKVKPAGATGKLKAALAKGSMREQQSALVALGDLKETAADKILATWLDKLLADKVPAALKLELLEAAAKRSGDTVKAKLAKFNESRPDPRQNFFALEPYAETLEGGQAEKGKKLFYENVALSCVRCHVIDGQGGEVGPVLDDIGTKVDRKYLLESIVNPNASIAKGYNFFLITLKNGQGYAGIIKSETDKEVVINSPEDGIVTVKTADIKDRIKGPSGMPPGLQSIVSKSELRDLIEFLAQQKKPAKKE